MAQPPPRARWSDWLTLSIAAACASAALVLATAEISFDRAATSLASLVERAQTRTALQTLMRRLLDAETAQRGYLLTGRSEYLVPLEHAQIDIVAALDLLATRNAGDAAWQGDLALLRERSLEKLSEVGQSIMLFDQQQTEGWRSLLLTDIGREKMEAAREAAEGLLAAEDQRVLLARQAINRTLRNARLAVPVMTVLSLLALIFYFRNSAELQRLTQQRARDEREVRNRLEAEVRDRTAELTQLARHLQTAREDERAHLARELHDELGALLTAAKFDVSRLRRALGTAPTPELVDRLAHLNGSIDQGISLKRRIIEDLRPSALSNLGLKAALQILARDFEERSGLAVHIAVADVQLSPEVQLVVYRVVQEAFTNTAKHAMAGSVRLKIERSPADTAGAQGVHLRLADDGRGMQGVEGGKPAAAAHGLVGMRFRVESVGGQITISSPPGQGTVIDVLLPGCAQGEAPDPSVDAAQVGLPAA